MLGTGEKVSFTLHIYNYEKGLLGTVKIPDDVYSTFKLPLDTDMVEVKEFDGNFSLKNIFRIYLGVEKTMVELLDNNKGIVFSDNIDLESVDVNNSRLCYVDSKNYVSKVLDVNEIVVSDLEKVEDYIKKLSKEIGKLNRQSDNVRKLIRRNNG